MAARRFQWKRIYAFAPTLARALKAGGFPACSRWLSDEGATPPDYDRYNTAPRKGASREKRTLLASLPDAFFLLHWFRWYRSPSLTQPPATSYHASGMKNQNREGL